MRLALVFDKTREDTTGVYFERACQALGIHAEHFWTRQAEQIPSGYDLYVRIDHGDYHEDVPPPLRPRIFYAIDTHLPKSWKKIRRLARGYDLVCCAQRAAANALPNGAWVPFGCDPAVHRGVTGLLHWEVAFVGTEGGVPRKFYLQLLRERYPRSFIGHAPHTQLGRIYSQAKIGFNYSIREDLNMRIFEILSAGTLLVTNRLQHDDLGELGLHDRQHYVSYGTPTELFEVIDYYVQHEQERQAIAMRGMTAVQQHHTYPHRLQQLLTLAAERIGLPVTIPRHTPEASACVS